jgi:hypothetical protein
VTEKVHKHCLDVSKLSFRKIIKIKGLLRLRTSYRGGEVNARARGRRRQRRRVSVSQTPTVSTVQVCFRVGLSQVSDGISWPIIVGLRLLPG